MKNIYDVIIIGSGPAGYTAAIYAARALLKTIVFAGSEIGGQLTTTTTVENFPGFPEGITGPDLMEKMKKQASGVGAEVIIETVKKIIKVEEGTFQVQTDQAEYLAKTIILATGATARWLGLPSEQRLRGHGVSACATCDGFFFRDKRVAVVGAGDAAMEEANFLTKFASEVYLIVRSAPDKIRASKIMLTRAINNPKIKWYYNAELKEVYGDDKVTGLRLINNQTQEEEQIELDGVFLAIGHQPNTHFIKDLVAIDARGYVAVSDYDKTAVAGIFAAGDVADYRYRQAITAAGSGCQAAIDVIKYLAEIKN
ncbi:MAG: thioredoxin-disulfide reductase [Candidatus Komeilibacteria bacterium CG_4_10_14_0_2_um_filter_37_10]|uniref:Thioredoxin reductase n=1 Tax=Candidatus Komeilibacteria bacterium CG_4_10_14_0_2_um_filter_37_10 TaxID=1974470 RepID=A0A2M7VD62_9BACT|nr:MAG: thioredoxin-disulfide reductase [Candidatus Komeilibacteria bacterium CG_4_10_14_0_2_um_filter_37_10]